MHACCSERCIIFGEALSIIYVIVTMPKAPRGRQPRSKGRAPARRSARATTIASTTSTSARTSETSGHPATVPPTDNPAPIANTSLTELLELVREQVRAELHSHADQIQRANTQSIQPSTSTPAPRGTCLYVRLTVLSSARSAV